MPNPPGAPSVTPSPTPSTPSTTPSTGAGRRREDVLDALGHRIVAGDLPPGTVLTLEGVDATYGVSRSVSREAVQVLGAMGLVTSRRRVGITVSERAAWNVFDPRLIRWRLDGAERDAQLRSLSELRAGFEPAAAALAAQRATAEQAARMASAVSDMTVHARARDLDAYLAADQVFHTTMLAASGNEMYAALADVVGEVLAGRTHHHLMPADPNPDAIEWHAEVARAVRRGEPAAAEDAMRRIITEAQEAQQTLAEQAGPGDR
ncbi:FadR family transcriptional regulator [Nocardioides sp. ChNu-153]|uniref:FadR/GntR family transcriptional regulator n=1 Tax=Nocardioides sp. ChNu-153 TaxID=2779364 RepID=UPI0026525219|nr:FCD domain-containing protein [Nocardioides sp. ChNu-153]MDN7123121.1 FadR family transcriptional regulator [Nocardioides sp. ChNu-153]